MGELEQLTNRFDGSILITVMENKFKLTVYISHECAKMIGHKAVDESKTKSEVVDEILAQFFGSVRK